MLDTCKAITGIIDKIRVAKSGADMSSPEALGNDTLRANFYEVGAMLLDTSNALPAAIEMTTKGCAPGTSIYSRKRLIEVACHLSMKAALVPKAKPFEIPKFDSPFLNALAHLYVAENATSRETSLTMITKAAAILVRSELNYSGVLSYFSCL